MKTGDHFKNKESKRICVVVGANDTYVEYKYLELKVSHGTGKRKTKPNTACVTRVVFTQKFEAVA